MTSGAADGAGVYTATRVCPLTYLLTPCALLVIPGLQVLPATDQQLSLFST